MIFISKFKFWVFLACECISVCARRVMVNFLMGRFRSDFVWGNVSRWKKRKNFSVGAKYKLYFPIQIKRVHADEKNAAKKTLPRSQNRKITKNRKYKGIHQRTRIIILSHRFFSTAALETSRWFFEFLRNKNISFLIQFLGQIRKLTFLRTKLFLPLILLFDKG